MLGWIFRPKLTKLQDDELYEAERQLRTAEAQLLLSAHNVRVAQSARDMWLQRRDALLRENSSTQAPEE